MWETVDAHSGYTLPWSPFRYIPGFLGSRTLTPLCLALSPPNNQILTRTISEGHDWHHSHNRGNFGILSFWDWICGTDREYRDWLKNPTKHKGVQEGKTGAVEDWATTPETTKATHQD